MYKVEFVPRSEQVPILSMGPGEAIGPREFSVPEWKHPGDYEVVQCTEATCIPPRVAEEGVVVGFFQWGSRGTTGYQGLLLVYHNGSTVGWGRIVVWRSLSYQ